MCMQMGLLWCALVLLLILMVILSVPMGQNGLVDTGYDSLAAGHGSDPEVLGAIPCRVKAGWLVV